MEKKRSIDKEYYVEILFSFLFQVYSHALAIPSFMVASKNINAFSIINISLTYLLVLIISNNDYDYIMKSSDSLRQKYSNLYFLQQIVEGLVYILVIQFDNEQSALLILFISILEILRLAFLQPYFDENIQILATFLQVYFFLCLSTFYILIQFAYKSNHLLSVFILLYIPLTFCASKQIQVITHQYQVNQFEKGLQNDENIGPEILNYIARKTVFNVIKDENSQNHAEIKHIAYLIKCNILRWNLYRKEIEQSHKNQENEIHEIEELLQEKEENLLGGYQVDATEQKGRLYIGKEQVFGENKDMKKALRNLFNSLYIKERNSKQFTMIDIYYLIYIVEVLKNYQFFELTTTQISKNISLKHQQILYTVMKEVERQKQIISTLKDQNKLFDQSYYEALIYDELILQTQSQLEDAVQKKIQLLQFMKQKYINLEELQIQLEYLLSAREQLIKSITLMVRVNEYNQHLYDIYLNFLETLAFSETDIKLERYNRYKQGQRQIYFQMNSTDACIVFASLKNEKNIKIVKVSNNIEHFLGYQKQHLINNSIEMIMPSPYAQIHNEYVMNFFAMGDTQSYLQTLLLFALTSSNHIIPVNVDIKVNLLEAEKEFGMTAFIQKQKTQTQYILFDSSSSKLISMTPEINQFIFSTIHNFNKVALASFFPFIQHFKTTVGSSLFSKTSQMTLNSIRTKQLFSNQSIRSLNSDENRTNKSKDHKKPKSLKDQYIIQKQIVEAKDKQNDVTKKQQDDQYQREQNRKQHIINSLRDRDIEDSFQEDDDRKYRNLQFLLVINSQDNLFMQLKSRRVQSLSDFKFYLMNLNLYTCPSPGLDQLKYLELTQIKSINPLHNSKFILQIYNDELDGYLTNLHTFRNSDIQCILTELETKGIKESNRNSNNQDNPFYTEDEEDENDYDLINSRRGGGGNYREVQLHKFDGYQKNNDNSEIAHQLAGTKNFSHDDLDKSLKSTTFGRGESLFTQKRDNGGFQIQINSQKNSNEDQTKDQNQEISFHHIDGKQEQQQKNIEQSSLQAFKHNQSEISSSFQFGGIKQQNYNNDVHDYSYYPQQKFNELDNNNNNNNNNNNQIIDQIELKDQNLGTQSQNQLEVVNFKNSNQDLQKPLTSKKLLNNELINYSSNKFELLSPNENNSSQQIFQFKSTGLITQTVKGGGSQQNITSTNKVNDQLFQQQSTNSQLMNDVFIKGQKNLQPKRQVSLSVHSLSKKRKQIIASHKNQIRYLKDALDQSSNHSRQSTASSTKKATKRIILERNTIGVMKVVNLIGILSFLIIIAVIVEQYISMHIQFNAFADDLNYVNWSTQYEISLYLIMKNYNLNTLLQSSVINVPSDIQSQMQDTAIQEMYQSVTDVSVLIKNLSSASSDLQILKGMLQTSYFFKLGSFLDHSIPITGQSSSQMFLTVERKVSLYQGSIYLYSYLYRYSRGFGIGLSQFIAVNNQEAIVKALKEVSIQCQNFSINQLSNIEVDVNNVLIIIIIVTAFCIFIIIPLYYFIQSKREQIIQLFGTFNSSFIDESIFQIQKIYSRNNNIKTAIIQSNSKENQKKQNLSSTSRLNKVSRGVLIMVLMIFLLTLPYPILNKALSTSYINQNKDSLPLLEQLYSIQAFILDYTSLSFFTIVLKVQASSIQYSYQEYETKLLSYVAQSQNLQTSLQQILQSSRNAEMFDVSTFNKYFMATFENDSCGNIFKYPNYLPQNYTLTLSGCKSVLQGIMNKGLSISINNYFQILQNLQQIIQINDINKFQDKLDLFSKENNLQEFVTFQVYLVEILEALSIYLKSESNVHKSQLEDILLGLLIYQFLIMGVIFYFGWVIFYKNMDRYLYKTKQYLAILNINYLIQNPYIQNYLHKNLS
ncbi:transmembrane protein, putative (macronuclear) [Tetrahymena thermophila SB210]|uniref:Transmembrane protein, putative n=1 Tax=Tetrahymena thermophila (strain SB210) TaxID=312017 RepID=I7MIF2_TETTS|nr:transmembrane protein, putative [Tetrahymena thermophila SB210]EAS04338.2 transmembrane protein, putative [Tetrahymena thermophila SB210]|eukprot:XP_001024583.2 transmembrane protein, putative [Tetrahymena thermophila SB210]